MANHETVGIVAFVRKARQLALPVGRDQAKRVPALGTPRMASALLLEYDMIDSDAFEIPAD